jgi:uncharacterized protein YrrD
VKELVRGRDLVGLPIVTLAGDDVAEVRDVMFDADAGHIVGFTLNKRGRFRGRMREVLMRSQVGAVGPDAIMIDPSVVLAEESVTTTGAGGNVLSDRVITDAGVAVGTVTDVVVDTGDGAVVGYEVQPADDTDRRNGRRSYIPLLQAVAVSGEALVVPASAVEYIASDLAGFGDAVDRYRDALRGDA